MTYCLVILIVQQEEKLQYINLLSNKKSYVCENDQVKSSIWWKKNFENLHIEKHYSASFFSIFQHFVFLCCFYVSNLQIPNKPTSSTEPEGKAAKKSANPLMEFEFEFFENY